MNKDFQLFQKEFLKWQERFGLKGYSVFFHAEPMDGASAEIAINLQGMAVDVTLNSDPTDQEKKFKDIKKDAKHEAIHLLIGRLAENAKYRHVTSGELRECVEELVIKLEGLINERT